MNSTKNHIKQAVLAEGKMIFNKEDLALLASSQSLSCDKEGPLFIQEKSEGFFKRTEVTAERWCKLRGNLLFYFKSRDSQSQPAGVIVLENVTITRDNSAGGLANIDGTFGLLI